MKDSSIIEPRFVRYLPRAFRDYLRGRQNLSLAIANTGWILAEKFFRLLLAVFVGAWVARYLGPAQFGRLSYIMALLAVFQVIATLGVDAILVRELSTSPEKSGELLGSAIFMRALASIMAWLALIGTLTFSDDSDLELIKAGSILGAALLFQSADVLDVFFQSRSENKTIAIIRILTYLFVAGIKVACILSGAGLAVFAAITSIEFALVAVGLAIAFYGQNSVTSLAFHYGTAKRLFLESWPLVLAGLCIILYMRLDLLMVKSILGDLKAGYYSAAMSLSTLWHVIPVSLCASSAPMIVRKKILGEKEYYDAMSKLFRANLFIALTVCLSVYFFAEVATNLLYGGAFLESAQVLKIHVFTNIPIFLGVARGLWTTNEGRHWFAAGCTLLGALSCLALNALLLPRIGLIGAAIAAVSSQVISAVLSSLLLDRRIFMMQFGLRSIAANQRVA